MESIIADGDALAGISIASPTKRLSFFNNLIFRPLIKEACCMRMYS